VAISAHEPSKDQSSAKCREKIRQEKAKGRHDCRDRMVGAGEIEFFDKARV
jgi:hypothetical protein